MPDDNVDPLDEYFAQNMTRFREAAKMSQAELVTRLRKQGWNSVHPTTISRIEKGERPVRLSEADRIARVLGQDLSRMMSRPRHAGIEAEVDKTIEDYCKRYNQTLEGAYWLLVIRTVLQDQLASLHEVAEREGEQRLLDKYEEGRTYLQLRIDTAVEAARAAREPGGLGGQNLLDKYGVTAHAYHPADISEDDINAPRA